MRQLLLLFLLTLAIPVQNALFATHLPDGKEVEERAVVITPVIQTLSGINGPRLVAIEMELFIESEVQVQVSDALGYEIFQSTASYPEGRQVIRLSLGNMQQGIYFIRVSTDLEEHIQVVSLLKK